MSHQNLKKISGILIDHKRNKICKIKRFLKQSLFQICQICLILTKKWLLSANSEVIGTTAKLAY